MDCAVAIAPTMPSQEDDTRPVFTIAICTYNGAQRFPEVLDCLKNQVGADHFLWEVIIIDNNSRDETAQIIQKYQEDWPFPIPLRSGFELRQGVAYARQLAIRMANSDLIGFLDDDNLPDLNWVAAAYAFSQSYPQVAAYGSQIHGQFEVSPPPNFKRIQSFLALTQRGSEPHVYHPWLKVLPPGAGLVIRKQVWLDHVPAQLMLTGRYDGHMLTGEDLEAISYIQLTDWEIWHNPAMKVQHKIPKSRLQKEYLIPFFQGIGLSRHVTRMLSVKPWQRPFMFWIYLVNDGRKILSHWLVHRDQLTEDIVLASELQLYKSSLLSPFYIWWLRYFKKP